jgi:hypothetical protein
VVQLELPGARAAREAEAAVEERSRLQRERKRRFEAELEL